MSNITVLQLDEIGIRSIFQEEISKFFQTTSFNKESNSSAKYLTRAQTAERFHITLPTLHAWTMEGKVQAYRIGRRVLYLESEIQQALSSVIVRK